MRRTSTFAAVLLAVLTAGPLVFGDEIILRSGSHYSGRLVRADANTVEFRILDRVQSFKTSEVAQIIFKEPGLDTTAADRKTTASTAADAGATQSQIMPPVRPTNVSPTPQAAPVSSTITLPEGTPLTIRTSTAIDTDRNRVGDTFDATLDEPVTTGDQTVFPRGALVRGRIAYAKESGRISGQSQLVLELTEIDANGGKYTLRTSDYTEVGSSRGNRTAATVGGTAALGAIIGAIAGGGKGAAVGAASGAAVGTGVQVLTRGQTLKIPAETILEFRLQSALTVDKP